MSAKILGSRDMTAMRACFKCVSVCVFLLFFFFYGALTVNSFFNGKTVERRPCNIESCEEGGGKDSIYNWLTSFSKYKEFSLDLFLSTLNTFSAEKNKNEQR